MALVSRYPLIKNTDDYFFNSGEFNETEVIHNTTGGKIYQDNFTANSNISKTMAIDELTDKNTISVVFRLKISNMSSQTIFETNCVRNTETGTFQISYSGNTLTVSHTFFDTISATLDENWHQIAIRIEDKMQIFSDQNLVVESELTDVSRKYKYTGESKLYLGSFIIQNLFIVDHYLSDYELQYYYERPIIRYDFEQTDIVNEAINNFAGTGTLTYSDDCCKGTHSAIFNGNTFDINDYPKLNVFTLLFRIKITGDGNILTFGNITLAATTGNLTINGQNLCPITNEHILLAIEYDNGNRKASVNGEEYFTSINLPIIYDNNSAKIGGFSGVLSEFQLIPVINADINEMWNVKASVDNKANFYIGHIACSGIIFGSTTSGYIDNSGNITTSATFTSAKYTDLYRVYGGITYIFPTISTDFFEILEYDNNLNYIGRYPGIKSGKYMTAEDKFIRVLFLEPQEIDVESFYFYDEANNYELNPILTDVNYTIRAAGISENITETNPVFEVYKNDVKARNIYEK